MNIGEFKNVGGRLLGSIATRTIDLPRLGLRQVESTNERAPVFEILALNVGNRWVQIGALWEAVAKNTTGEAFLQGTIDDPSLSEPLPIALFGSDEEGFRVAWRRPQPRDAFAPLNRGAPRREDEGAGAGGFGDSTAGEGGALGTGAELDDEIPF
ncbi:DUF736 domain-containing protein [Novosphingobium sp. G106]|uniref:DUF736 domain-containing protein n=1 Tax=Novosphingobium sp. G106 TaxID=2849500 RepID=UPI001C2DC927|nr:DUF736 domain-containing protein [Novosphingobium sp. G106]MBV1686432.1 DUF736 domain-containing protein [Novosphingobium sp. G106]